MGNGILHPMPRKSLHKGCIENRVMNIRQTGYRIHLLTVSQIIQAPKNWVSGCIRYYRIAKTSATYRSCEINGIMLSQNRWNPWDVTDDRMVKKNWRLGSVKAQQKLLGLHGQFHKMPLSCSSTVFCGCGVKKKSALYSTTLCRTVQCLFTSNSWELSGNHKQRP